MKTILFVTSDQPLTENGSGGAALKLSHLRLCMSIADNVHIAVTNTVPEAKFAIEGLDDLSRITVTRLDAANVTSSSSYGSKLRSRGMDYFQDLYGWPSRIEVSSLRDLANELDPDLVWTEHYLENYLALLACHERPIIFSHHDYVWKLMKLKNRPESIRHRAKRWAHRKAEIDQIRSNRFFVSGSQTELGFAQELNPKLVTALLPANYNRQMTLKPSTELKIVHFGSLSATANRVGLASFLRHCWPQVSEKYPRLRLHIVGNVDRAGPDLKQELRAAGIVLHGHVERLETVLLANDISIIPYEFDTGSRTKLPQLLNYRQVIVAHRNSVKGYANLVDGRNCVLVDSLDQMTIALESLIQKRIDIGSMIENGTELFEAEFTVSSQMPVMKKLVESTR